MKIHWKSITITTGLICLLVCIILMEISLFISGPKAKFDATVENQIQQIEKEYKDIKNVQRHVFQYIVYVGEENDRLIWFNEKAEAIVYKEKSTLRVEEAKRIGEQRYGWKDVKVSLGYGYQNPVYVLQSEHKELLLDYDTLDDVYYLDKGVK